MKIKIKKGCGLILLILVTTVFFATFLTIKNIFDVDNVSDKKERSNFDYYNLKSSQVSNKIYIEGDQGWADFKSDGNCMGLGTFSDPYIIKDIIIDSKNPGSGITIENSDVYFKIMNVTVYNSGSNRRSTNVGIKLQSSNNGSLINNTVVNNHYGIILIDSHNTTISGNNVNEPFYGGGEGVGIYLLNSNYNNISGNTVYNMGQIGIHLHESNSNIISVNILNNNRESRIYLSDCNNTKISGNNVSYSYFSGIYLSDCNNTLISGNTANYIRLGDGIIVDMSNDTMISHNNITYNAHSGMALSNSNENTISHNNITYNALYGMILYESNNNLILGNNLLYNGDPINERNCAGNNYQNNIIDENLVFPVLIVVPIIIGIIFLSIAVVFIYKKKVTNQ